MNVTAPAGCNWRASSSVGWVSITGAGAGAGSGTVTYSVAPYSGRLFIRIGTLTVAGKLIVVTQLK